MRCAQLVGTGALALALAATVGGSAQAAGEGSVKGKEAVFVSGTATFNKAGDQMTITCPAGMRVYDGSLTSDGPVQRTVYRTIPADGSWIVRVESTERTAPWKVDGRVYCTDAGIHPAHIDWIVEESHTVANVGDTVMVSCPAESVQDLGGDIYDAPPGLRWSPGGSPIEDHRVWCTEVTAKNGTEPVSVVARVKCQAP